MRLFVFLTIALSVYTAMHAVVYWAVRPIWAGAPRAGAAVIAWMAAMVAAPVAVRLLDRAGLEAVARPLAWAAYTWLGLVFLAFWPAAALGVGQMLASGLGALLPTEPLRLRTPAVAWAVLAGVVALGGYGAWEATRLRVERVRIASAKLSRPVRIVQVSDLHLGLLLRSRTLARVLRTVEALGPDLLVATGDLVDAQIDHLDDLSRSWASFTPPLGKLAVVGNHEVYAGLGQSLAFLEKGGFRVLRNEAVAVGSDLVVVGVDDEHAPGPRPDPERLFARTPAGRFVLLLKHRPTVVPGAGGRLDLQLSGHTHLGQIFPFRLLTKMAYPMQRGLYALPEGGRLYASRGTGTWGPPMRVLAPPEVTLIELVPEKQE
ncbi:metallophosphoesterase [Deferrisoma camini]|uniref:metallophosphoesterase n=1 Tax=Deferrisoma camini TaxID=1035120 RepID=UPI0004A3EFDF|nr:metallophosphoesterase [Deferrisoma camini]